MLELSIGLPYVKFHITFFFSQTLDVIGHKLFMNNHESDTESDELLILFFIAILFIFPFMFKTNMFHITLALRRFKLSIIARRCQGRVVISLFSNMTI